MLVRLVVCISLVLFLALSQQKAHGEESIINQYDANGSLVSGDGKFYRYNDASQLVKVCEDAACAKTVAEYFYDHSGQRVKKIENGVTTYYIGKHYETQVVNGQTQNTSYYFANGERVAKKVTSGIYFYHPDHLGGTSAVTNGSGLVASSTSYLPFGEVRQGGAESYSYTGKENDKGAGLYNFEARYVSPELRHFTQADIAEPDFEDPQDLNRYAYVGNNPLSFVDEDGYKKKKKTKKEKKHKEKKKHNSKKNNKDNKYVYQKYKTGQFAGECTDLARAITTFYGQFGVSESKKVELLNKYGFKKGDRKIDIGNIIVTNEGYYGHVAVVIGIENGVLSLIESNVPNETHSIHFRTIKQDDSRIYGAYDTKLR